jgi:DNA topoisomerase-1
MDPDTAHLDSISMLAGDCTVRFEGREEREERGAVLLIEKPDGTVLVHDREGYRPVAWLTRADSVSWSPDGPTIEAATDEERLTVICHEEHGHGRYPVSTAGREVGWCPDCGAPLVRERGAVACLGCVLRHSVPRDATVLPGRCPDCALPRMSVERGAAFETCVDRACESLDAAVRERFDRIFDCPACGGDLLVLRRGGLILGCENYPDCETGFSVPAGTIEGSCGCGLPAFVTGDGRRCLDASCGALDPAPAEG